MARGIDEGRVVGPLLKATEVDPLPGGRLDVVGATKIDDSSG